nr:unnamed protein product [Callosobruchus chinensis]
MIASAVLKKRQQKKRKMCRQWIAGRSRGKDVLTMVHEELLTDDPAAYRNFLRLNSDQFNQILSLVESRISRQNTVMRESISARNRLAITLRFLATGESFRSLMYSSRIHESTISCIISEVCTALIEVLRPLYLQTPNAPEQWKKIAMDFMNMWQYPLCLGALDGRHITFRAPVSSGSYFHNYKGTNSIILLGLVDAHYRFIYVNIGVNGRISDGGVFRNSSLSEAVYNNILNFPEPELLPGLRERLPYVIVADEAFPLSMHLMKPYPHRGLNTEERVFNYRLSRARRVVENAFGILANRFRVLLTPIALNVEKVEMITFTCVLLHNYLATVNHTAHEEFTSQIDNMQALASVGSQGEILGMAPQKVYNRRSLNTSVCSADSECLDLSIKGFYLIVYYPYSDPGQEFEIISEQDLVNTWEFLERGSHVTAKFGSAKVQGIVVAVSEEHSYLVNNFDNITEAFRGEMKPPKSSLAPRLVGTRIVEISPKIERHVVKVMDRGTQTEDFDYENDYLALKKKYDELKAEMDKFTSGVNAVQTNLEEAMNTLRSMNTEDAASSTSSNDACQENEDPFKVKVQIGPSGTKIEKNIFDSINWNSYTAATRKLLISLFPRKILATHSLTGKPSPAFIGTKQKKTRLDPPIINDIIEVVSKKCKVPETLVRSAITTKCADENKLYRKRLQKKSNTDSVLGETKHRL